MTSHGRAAAWLVLVLPGAVAAQSVGELDALRERIEQSRGRVERHEAVERDVFDRLEAIDRRRSELAVAVREADQEVRSTSAVLGKIESETKRLGKQLDRTRTAMTRRALALYKTGDVGPLRVLFVSGSLRELLQRASALRQLLAYDAALIDRFERDVSAYEEARSDAVRAGERHASAAARLRRERSALEIEHVNKQELLARVRDDRKVERELLVELERAAQALETTLAELGDAGRRHGGWLDGSGFAARRGKLPPPVDAGIVAPFGRVVDGDFLTQTVRNGVEFSARTGARVRAAARGEVRFAGWFRGYGKIVILDHGNSYFTVSGHLSRIDVEVGDRVGAGGTIGSAGDTGSLTGPSLYFELRKGSKALDPVPWFSPERLAEAR